MLCVSDSTPPPFFFFPLHFCANLRALDVLSDEVLVELSAAYRRMVSHTAPGNSAVCITLSITSMFARCMLTSSPSSTPD